MKKHKLFIFFTVLYFLFSLFTYKDYGATFDEKVEYDAGAYLYTYYLKQTTPAYVDELINDGPNNIETRHLPLFSVYSRAYPMLLSLLNPNAYLEWFHLLNLFVGYFIFLFGYLFFYLVTGNEKKSLFAPLLLFLTPNLLGHIPANPKDIPFATAYLAGIFFIYLFGKRKTDIRVSILVLGLVFGAAISLRTVGVTLLFTYLAYNLYLRKDTVVNVVFNTIFIGLVSLLVWIVSMPYLGANVFANMFGLLLNASSFQPWRGVVFYLGEYLSKEQRPWHYLFVLTGVKLPLTTVFFFLLGTLYSLKKILTKKRLRDYEFLLLFVIALNIAIYLVLKPVVYNGIRHFLYLLIPITLLAGLTMLDFVVHKKGRIILVTSYLLFTLVRMLQLHPYEYVYFNELTFGLKGAQSQFQLDYWGASYKEAAEYIRSLTTEEPLQVFSCDNWWTVAYYSQNKFELVGSPKESDLLICDTFRDDIRQLKQPVVHAISREGIPLLYVRSNQ